jgi:hypothetical protein
MRLVSRASPRKFRLRRGFVVNVDFRDGVSTQVIRDRHGGNPVRIEIVTKYVYYPKGGVKSVGLTIVVDADQSRLGEDRSNLDPTSVIAAQILKGLQPDLDAARNATHELTASRAAQRARLSR